MLVYKNSTFNTQKTPPGEPASMLFFNSESLLPTGRGSILHISPLSCDRSFCASVIARPPPPHLMPP